MLTRGTSPSNLLKSRMFLCATALSAASAFGCAPDGADLDEEVQDTQDDLALQTSGDAQDVPNPNGSYFAKVTARGTGCPAGTWDAEISPDGKTFRIRFDGYQTKVDENMSIDVKDCALSIKLHSPNGLSYSVSQFYYMGYVFLEEGVKARQNARYYFQGNPVAAEQIRADLIGPKDDTYLFEDKVGTTDTVIWSPCGVDRNLYIDTTLRLQNSTPRRNGYVNVANVNANTETKIVFNLAWKKCDAPGATNTTTGGQTASGGTTSPTSGGQAGNTAPSRGTRGNQNAPTRGSSRGRGR
jgi:hypothetical protein